MAPYIGHADQLMVIVHLLLIVGKEGFNRLVMDAKIAFEQAGSNAKGGLGGTVLDLWMRLPQS